MLPESLRLAPYAAPVLILIGYLIVHFFEHSLPAHFHFGEETHASEFLNPRVAYTALGGLLIHTFFDGVAITAGFIISTWLGIVISGAVIVHNIPEGFTIASIMSAAGKRRSAGLAAAAALAWVALGLARARRWSRTPALLTQLFVGIVGIYLLQGHRLDWGLASVVLAVLGFATIFAPPSMRALTGSEQQTPREQQVSRGQQAPQGRKPPVR